MEQHHRLSRKSLIGSALLAFVLMFVLSFVVLFLVEREVRTNQTQELKTQEKRVVKLVSEFFGREFNRLLSDLHFLQGAYEKDLARNSNFAGITEDWIAFSNAKRIYDQVRYLDATGDEKIRINLGADGAYAVPEAELENKSDVYYFSEAAKLPEEGIYISQLDLNQRRGEVVVPHRPMLRLSSPVYDGEGTLRGVILLNYLADYSLTRFRELAGNSRGEVILLNADGYRLSSADPSRDWNFMFEDKKQDTFSREFPGEWSAVLDGQEQMTGAHGLFTATKASMMYQFGQIDSGLLQSKVVMGDENWYIVSVLERNDANRDYFDDDLPGILSDVLSKNAVYFLLILLISGIVAFLVYQNRKTYATVKFYSERDPLTRAYNRRAGEKKINGLFPGHERRHFLFSLCFIDVNGLKEINDTLGHNAGDELIVSVADVIRQVIRTQDLLIRLGGDEFLIVFNGIDEQTAETIYQRVVDACERINREDGKPYLISLSHGIADFDNTRRMPVDDMINEADRKMYEEKAAGKASQRYLREGRPE